MYILNADPHLDTLTFRYVVPHLSSKLDETSPFQLISPGLFDTVLAFDRISTLPRDASELVSSSMTLIGNRIAGRGLSVIPIPTELLELLLSRIGDALVVVVSCTTELAAISADVLRRIENPILHAMPDSSALSRPGLRDYCLAIASYWAKRPHLRHHADALNDAFMQWSDPLERRSLDFMDRSHLLTLPNMRALEAVGYDPRTWDGESLSATTNEPYFAALKESVTPILDIRNKLIEQNPLIGARARTDLVLTVPGVLKMWRQNRNLPDFLNKDQKKIFKSVLRQIVTRDTYSFTLELPDGVAPADALSMPSVQSLLATNRSDLDVYTQILSIRATSNFSPVIRLPTAANSAFADLSQLVTARRAHHGSNYHKLNRLARCLSDRLSKNVPDWITAVIRQSERIKLVSDVPLEWMNIDGFPLMLMSDVSRIPVTPGNLSMQLLLQCSEIPISADAFQDVLVVRSFHPDDPVRPLLESSIKSYDRGGALFPHYNIVDVRNRDDLVNALNKFNGAILVYDGHGVHSSASDIGELVLVDGLVNAWQLRGEARIPPIVLLSACDTHPFDASHATVGNGFLAAGAATVLSTSVPVDGEESAIMIARLLYRIGAYLPLLIEHRPWNSFRWSEIFPGLQRRHYATDAIRRLIQMRILPAWDDVATKALADVGMAIDQGRDWLGLLITRISEMASCSEAHARTLLRTHVSFAESLMYSQLGNPELIVGVGPKTASTPGLETGPHA